MEGGYFRQVYRASEGVGPPHLPERFKGPRVFSTSIYYLLPGSEFSAFHRLKSDEIWHFYFGSPLTIHIIDCTGTVVHKNLGPDPEQGQAFQVVVGAGEWFAASVDDPSGFTLAGCTVSPGFDYEDHELAERDDLIGRYPQHRSIIERFTRQGSIP